MISKTALLALSTEIKDETGTHANTPARIGAMLDAIINAMLDDVQEVTTVADVVPVPWGMHTIIEAVTEANEVTVASTAGVAVQSLIIIENYSTNACAITLTDGLIRGTAPAGGWSIPSEGKVHLQITATGKISIAGV